MTNVVNLREYNRFNTRASKTNLDMTRALVATMKLADEKKSANVKEADLEKTVSRERQ
ncbi:MAG: hypothetical protein IJ870_03455 [Alphaproteobacteria bacterium]|nr:hypothetical protein [Alphaproteobacteria bacterium]